MELNAESVKQKIGSYWNRPGGKLGTIALWCVGGLFVWKIWDKVIPKFLEMLDDTTEVAFGLTKAVLAMGVAAFVVGGILYAVMNPRFRQGIIILWEKIFINSWLQVLIKVDPKKIALGKIEDFANDREKFSEQAESISGDLESTKKDIKVIDAKIIQVNKEIAVARSVGEAEVSVQEKGMAEEWRAKLLPLAEGLQLALDKCNQIYEASGWTLKKMKNQYEYTTKMYESTSKASHALKTAFSMFSGKSAAAQLGDEAMFFMEAQISQNIGSMKQDMRKLTEYTDSYDLSQRVYNQDALGLIKELNPKLYTMYADQNDTAIAAAGQTVTAQQPAYARPLVSSGDKSKLTDW